MSDFRDDLRGLSPQKLALIALDLRAELDARQAADHEAIAIVGMGCRFPGGAESPAEYWNLLVNGTDAIREIPGDRWPVDAYYDPDPDVPGKMYTKYGGFVDRLDRFDANLFGISPREARSMDPQQRMLLEVAWAALEDAAEPPAGLAGTAAGVFVGVCTSDYWLRCGDRQVDPHTGSGNAHSVVANRLSYLLDLRGPSLAVDTACSSSLVAIHLACASLRASECRLALAGGVNAIVSPKPYLALSKARMLARDGRCKTFDARADGYVRGEGCGLVVLKRLSDARADGNRIVALVRGSAVNQDGRSNGLTAPNLLAQQEVIRQALAAARVAPSALGYIEVHGTGTSLGDPIEIEALNAAIGRRRPPSPACVLGSVKTNIGHLEAAAGISGFMKAALAVERGEIPPHLHLRRLNPNISLAGGPFDVATARRPWPDGLTSRIAGVSSFGFGGTNAHIIVEQPPAIAPVADASASLRPAHVVCLSAATDTALRETAVRVARHARTLPNDAGGDLACTLNAGRSHFPHRLAVVARTPAGVSDDLTAWVEGVPRASVRSGECGATTGPPRIAFLFTGQGSQHPGMIRALFAAEPDVRRTLEECDALFRPHLPVSLLSVLDDPQKLDDTLYTQATLFSVEYAIATMWRRWGIEPAMVLGHSIGEYAAACVAGMYTLADAVEIVAARARLMQSLPSGGAMAAVVGDAAQAIEVVRERGADVDIAAVNSAGEIVISGARDALAALARELTDRGLRIRNLRVSHAFHSRLMDPVLDDLASAVSRVRAAPPRIPVVSNLTGSITTTAVDAAYWRRHARETVQFAGGMRTMADAGIALTIEVGPAPALSAFVRRSGYAGIESLASLRPGRDDWSQVLETLATLYVRGCPVDWAACYRTSARRRIAVPAYPFEGDRYWIRDVQTNVPTSSSGTPTLLADSGLTPLSPLLDRQLRLPMSKERRFELALLPDRLSYLTDHRIEGRVLFPAAAFAEMALEAAARMFGAGPRAIEHLTLSQALMIDDVTAAADLQIILTPESPQAAGFQIVAQSGGSTADWVVHATGRIVPPTTGTKAPAGSLESVRERCHDPIAPRAYYEWLDRQGLTYGERFRSIEGIWRGDGESLARVRLPAQVTDASRYQIHPVLLDGSLQAVGAAIQGTVESEGDGVYLPVSAARLELESAAPSDVWASIRIAERRTHGSNVSADIVIFDDSGRRIAGIEGLRLKRVPRGSFGSRHELDDAYYEVVWREQPMSAERAPAADAEAPFQNRRWIVFADDTGVGAALAAHLRESGSTCVLVRRGAAYDESAADDIALDPERPEHFARLLASAPASDGHAVIHLWNLDARGVAAGDPDAVRRAEIDGCASLLHLVQAAGQSPRRLWIVTAGAQAVGGEVSVQAPLQAASWGAGRVVAREHPELRPVMIDLDPFAPASESARQLASELLQGDRENQIAWRDGVRHVARLERWSPAASNDLLDRPSESYRLTVTRRGTLDGLELQPSVRARPQAGEVEVCVSATGLNFRDVLNVLGLYPGDPGPLGLECAGVVSAIGDGVERLHVGDRVVAIAPASFSRYVTTPASLVAAKPERLTDAAAATLPVTFLTAVHALRNLARVKKGERVLVHAAAGGVGLAAIQIARLAGADVFATAGTEVKREYLRSIGVERVSDSRSARFVDDVRAWAPDGIDVVLNSLAGDLIAAGVSLLRAGGRFIEIGKQPEWNADRVHGINPAVSYAAFDLFDVIRTEPPLFRKMLSDLMADIEARRLSCLPHRVFQMRRVARAFRYMAQARHIGKVVVSHASMPAVPSADPSAFRADATYVITGGMGALGLEVAAWAVARGAREVCLLGRSEPSTTARSAIAGLESAGAHVTTARVDVSDFGALATALTGLEEKRPPIRGIFHLAGVLDDGLLRSQRWDQWRSVLAPKVDGAWNLHALTVDRPLDFLVLFSSASALFGPTGQASYAAANAFLDALAAHRASRGMPTVSVNYGPWAGDGMAAGVGPHARHHWSAHGFTPLAPAHALSALERVMMSSAAHVAVVPVDWTTLVQSGGMESPFLSALARRSPSTLDTAPARAPKRNLVTEWRAAPRAQHHAVITAYVGEVVCRGLGLDPQRGCPLQQPLGEIGLDSLMAVEIRNTLAADVERTLPATLLFDCPTVDAISSYLETAIFPGEERGPEKREATSAPRPLEQALLAVEQLSDRDVEAALLAKAKPS